MSEKNNPLELYILEKVKQLDSKAHLTKASGACGSHGDIASKYFIFECKQKLTKDNIIIDYKKEWLKTLNKLPANELRPVIIVTENKQREKFITMSIDDFFALLGERK